MIHIKATITFDEEDKQVLDKVKDKQVLVVYNKSDLGDITIDELSKFDSIKMSTMTDDISKLKEKISEIFNLKDISKSDYTYISNARQISLLKRCLVLIDELRRELENDVPVDLLEINIKELWETLGEITGNTYKDELLDEIFSKFCLGK